MLFVLLVFMLAVFDLVLLAALAEYRNREEELDEGWTAWYTVNNDDDREE